MRVTRFWNRSAARGASLSGMCRTITKRWRRWRAATDSSNLPPRWGRAGSDQQLHRIDGRLFQLIERALLRRLVRPPAQDRGAVAKSFAAEMIVADLDDQFRLQRAPLRRTLGGPAAGAARCIAGETGLCDQRFELLGQR